MGVQEGDEGVERMRRVADGEDAAPPATMVGGAAGTLYSASDARALRRSLDELGVAAVDQLVVARLVEHLVDMLQERAPTAPRLFVGEAVVERAARPVQTIGHARVDGPDDHGGPPVVESGRAHHADVRQAERTSR